MSREELHQTFFDEAEELIEGMEAELLELLFEPDNTSRINNVFRVAHSIKGGAAAFGFVEIAEVTHVMETLMDAVRAGTIAVSRAMIDVLLGAADCLGNLVEAARRGAAPDSEETARTRAALERCLAQPSTAPDGSVSSVPPMSPDGASAAAASAEPDRGDGAADADRSRVPEGSSIRVDVDKIDALINLVGELLIAQSALSDAAESPSQIDADRLREGVALLERHARALQQQVLAIRMVPISNVFQRLPRVVHDLSTRLGKRVELVVHGEHTELDKTLMERLGDPLVHLIRNAIDHGVETASARARAGKPEAGLLEVSAYHADGDVVLDVCDDGAGLDGARILEMARLRGLVRADATLSEQQIHELVFRPGFSTVDRVSEVSGRGVGMDVVRQNVLELGGTVEIASDRGQGTRVTLRLPLTLAIIDGQLLEVAGQIFVAPLLAIVESIRVRPERLRTIIGRGLVYLYDDDGIPVLDPGRLFGLAPDPGAVARRLMLVVKGSEGPVGLLVDELLSQQQVVVKSLEANYQVVPGISGATVLGDGRVALILDAAGISRLPAQDGGSPVPDDPRSGSRAA